MRLQLLAVLLGSALAVEQAPSSLQIGIRNKVSDSECTRKTRKGDIISVDYKGSLFDTGAEFDASYNRGKPFTFTLGNGQVIKGWDQGLLDMCIGEVRKLVIPPSLGYGENGAGRAIPGGATLVFEVVLRDIQQAKEEL